MSNEKMMMNKVEVLKALAHPTRLKIIEMLKEGERCVCEINVLADIEQSNISQHLAILRKADILTSRKDGSKVIYRVKYDEIFQILKILEDLISVQLKAQIDFYKEYKQKQYSKAIRSA
ncbi:MAG: Regulatory protein ArsR [Desulfotomaculum sp. 46_80]|nr:MAG: Regulatory protein ArsR [Desulfotomaculum sp. 46_80]HAU30816.1 ArsR family transcriptional regulator [Desulfotomaculum sp.]